MHRLTRTGFARPCGCPVPFLLTLLLASCSAIAETRAVQDAPLEPLRAEGLEALRKEYQGHVDGGESGGVVLLAQVAGGIGSCEASTEGCPHTDAEPLPEIPGVPLDTRNADLHVPGEVAAEATELDDRLVAVAEPEG